MSVFSDFMISDAVKKDQAIRSLLRVRTAAEAILNSPAYPDGNSPLMQNLRKAVEASK
jgi:hypothetical protein